MDSRVDCESCSTIRASLKRTQTDAFSLAPCAHTLAVASLQGIRQSTAQLVACTWHLTTIDMVISAFL